VSKRHTALFAALQPRIYYNLDMFSSFIISVIYWQVWLPYLLVVDDIQSYEFKSCWCAYLPLTYKEFNWREVDVYQHYVVLYFLW